MKSTCVLNVPFQIYEDDFSFIVNGEEFRTSRIISDLLSPIISKIHLTDPAFNTFIINTHVKGDFSYILSLANFNQINIPESEVPFISEVVEILNNDSIKYLDKNTEITKDNVFSLIRFHEKFHSYYSSLLSKEIDFISSHFHELCEHKEEEFLSLSFDTIFRIINNKKLRLKTEDQLLKFINAMYSENSEYSILYETVLFDNVTTQSIQEFISIYDINDISQTTWNQLSKRLESEIKNKSCDQKRIEIKKSRNKRYMKLQTSDQIFEYTKGNEFNGIINFLRIKSNDQINKEINFSSSSVISNNTNRHPHVVSIYDDQMKYFHSNAEENGWICFDFKDKKVIPTDYTIRSFPYVPNCFHPRSWVIEGSNDKYSWDIIDEKKDCPYLNGKNLVFTFNMNHKNHIAYKYIRMRLTGPNWDGSHYFGLDSFELFGQLEISNL